VDGFRDGALDSKVMGKRRAVRRAFVCLLAGAASAPFPRAAAQQRERVDELAPLHVEVVRLDVVVTEKRGRPLAGLRREDFAVFEDGVPQEIVQFQAFARPGSAVTRAPVSEEPPPATAEPEPADETLPARYVVLVIDDVHMESDSLSRVRKALDRFLE
jgi:hypothetical protein